MGQNRVKAVEDAKNIMAKKFFVSAELARSSALSYRNFNHHYEKEAPKELEERIVEMTGAYIGYGRDEETILFQTEEGVVEIILMKDTAYSDSITDSPDNQPIRKGERLYIIAISVPDFPIYLAISVILEEEKALFDQVHSLFGKGNAIINFYTLFKDHPEKKEVIKNQLKCDRQKRYDSSRDVIFGSSAEQTLKYAMCKETYTTEAQRAIESMYRDSNASKHKTEQKINYLSRISYTYKDRVSINKKELERILDDRFYKMEAAKQQLVDFLVSNEHAHKRGFSILLVGGAGVGKTSLMETIADAYHLPSEIIPLNGMATPLELEGLDSGYDNADAGRIIKAFAGNGTSEMVIGLDEIDKMNSHSKEGDPMNGLYRILLGKHEDKFLGCSVSTENTIFIATANSLDRIPEPIKNRFHAIIHLPDYSVGDKMVIARRHSIPDILKNFECPADALDISDEDLHLIITDYCGDGGARDLQHNLERLIRHKISCNEAARKWIITQEDIHTILDPLVELTPAVIFNRNRDEYSEPVASEICQCLLETKDKYSLGADQEAFERKRQKLWYLLACRNERGTMDTFDPVHFSAHLHKHLFGMDKVIKEATVFYHTAYLQGEGLNTNLALCGSFGIGKTTIVRHIAEAMGYHFVKISLNGIDEAKILRGFSSTYVGSEPGRFIKGVRKAGSLRTVFQLDEIDKINPDCSIVLLDLLDREFTDNFLDIPVDFSQSIFIATANDWSKVPAVIRDRFIVVNVDGYTREDKQLIVSEYIVPKIEEGYGKNNVSVTIDKEAEKYLLTTHCSSFGVRDAEKAIQRITGHKLVDQINTADPYHVHITQGDIQKYMGEEPLPRGNFPVGQARPGISKALAVSNGNVGNTFAIETVLIDGTEGLEMTGLPRETASDSVKIAITCIKHMYPQILKDKYIHVHFGEGSVPKDGPSAGVALFMSILSAGLGIPIMDKKPYDIAYTGEISLTGGIFAVGGVYEKVQGACDSGCTKVFVPAQNYERIDKKKLDEFSCEIIPVNHVSEVLHVLRECIPSNDRNL